MTFEHDRSTKAVLVYFGDTERGLDVQYAIPRAAYERAVARLSRAGFLDRERLTAAGRAEYKRITENRRHTKPPKRYRKKKLSAKPRRHLSNWLR